MLPLFICPYLYIVLPVPLMALAVLLNTAASNVKVLSNGVWVALAQNPPLASHLAQVKTVTQWWSAKPHLTSPFLNSSSLTRSLPSTCQEDSTLPSSFTTEVNLVSLVSNLVTGMHLPFLWLGRWYERNLASFPHKINNYNNLHGTTNYTL